MNTPTRDRDPLRRWILGLTAFAALSATAGSVELLAWNTGHRYLPIELLAHTPFSTFLVPGLLLGLVVAAAHGAALIATARRARAAVDLTVLAGGALTVWIVAEVALFRSVHALQVLYGALGIAILGLGVAASLRSREPRHRWVVAVTLGEALGFLAPAAVGVWSARAGLDGGAQAALVCAAGLLEGLALGTAQALVLPVHVRRARFAILTALSAAAVWGAAMGLVALTGGGALSAAALTLLVALAAPVGLLAIGGAQWIELRHHAPRAHRWIAWTALAWMIALPLSFTPAPLVDETTPLLAHLLLWGAAGWLMAYAMALMTWQGARRLVDYGAGTTSGVLVR